MKPTYSVIILIYHRTKALAEMATDCLSSAKLHAKGENVEFIVVDNGSTVKDPYLQKEVNYIDLGKNTGISHGWNAGLKASKGKYKLILGDDTVMRPNYLPKIRKAMDMPLAGTGQPHIEHLPYDTGLKEILKWPSGACFMLTQNTIDKVAEYDKKFFPDDPNPGYFCEEYVKANWEDVDYWTRLLGSGLKIYRNFKITVQHKEGQTVHSKDISQHFLTNKMIFIKRFGFDAQAVFFGDEPFPFNLQR